jgi:hypothetical protein
MGVRAGASPGVAPGTTLATAVNTAITTLGASIVPISLLGGGLSVTIPVTSRPIKIFYSGTVYHSTTAKSVGLALFQDGTLIDQVILNQAVGLEFMSISRRRTFSPAAGSHTYEVKLTQANATANAFSDGSTVANGPLVLEIEQG